MDLIANSRDLEINFFVKLHRVLKWKYWNGFKNSTLSFSRKYTFLNLVSTIRQFLIVGVIKTIIVIFQKTTLKLFF